MNNEKLAPISVVIPCYRCADTIQRALSSVSRQTIKPTEVILIDDASNDGTLTKLNDMANQHPNWIKVISSSKNNGAASTRNAGWGVATQPYIAFLDADDSWHPNKLDIQYGFMQSNPDITLCGHQCVYIYDSETMPDIPKNLSATNISAAELLFKNAFSTPTVMLKRDIPFRFQEGKRYAEDVQLWQKIAFTGLKVVRLESALAYIYKPQYGAIGLSAQLWQMEKGELNNFVTLYQAGSIHFILYAVSTVFSVAKFIKRFVQIKINDLLKMETVK